jgi:tetratricopeptide (TPR) repeat protein
VGLAQHGELRDAGLGAPRQQLGIDVLLLDGAELRDQDLAAEYKQTFRPEDLARAIPDPAQLALANQAIDRFTADYRKAVRDSCRATRGGTQSAEIGDKRTGCLERAKRSAWFVTSGLTTGIDKRPGLATIVEELPDVSACSDPTWLARAMPMPATQADREALYLAESDLLRAVKVRDDGNLGEASRLLEGVNATARRLDDRVLDARASMLAVEIARDKGDMSQAERDAVDAWSAASVSGDTNLTLRAQLVMLLATASHSKRALESFSGLGNVPDSADGARLIVAHGDALMAVGWFKEGEAEYRRAQTMREKVLPAEHVERALGRQRIGAALVVQKRAAEALPILTETAAILEKIFPPLRREAIDGVRYLAMTEDELGHHERAAELYHDVYERRVKVLGPNGGLALDARKDYARALCDLGEADRCMRELEETIASFVELAGDRTGNVADARVSLANHFISAGRIADADAQLARALPVLEKIHGADSPYAMVGQYAQVRSWTERPKPVNLDAATQALDRIEPVFAKLFGASSHPVGAVLSSRARIAIAKHDAKSADALMQRSIATMDDSHRVDRAEAELLYADVLAALGKRDAARAMAEAAAKDYEASGSAYAKRALEARAWPARPPPPPVTPAPPDQGPCAKAGSVFLDIWPAGERDLIASFYRKDPEIGEALLGSIDKYVTAWRAAAKSACMTDNRQHRLCLDRMRQRASARIRNAANGTLRALKSVSQLPSFTACANAKDTLPPDNDSYTALEEAERSLEDARVMIEIEYWPAVYRSLQRVDDKLRDYKDPSLAERAAKLEAEVEVLHPRKKPGSGSGSAGP